MSAGEPPEIPNSPPAVVGWFKVYCGILCLVYAATAAASIYFFIVDPAEVELGTVATRLIGGLLLLLGLALFAACLLPLLLTPRPWLWTYDFVIICLGMTSACFLPVCVPLLIFWIKPETKRHFGKVE